MTGAELTPAEDDEDPRWEIRSCPECGVVVLMTTRPVPAEVEAEYLSKLSEHRRRRHQPPV